MRFSVETTASPEQVLRALTDFSERRPQIWSKTLDPKVYELRELGDTWAVAKEGTAGSPFWVVERYDWSDPTVVRWTDEDSSWGGLGSGEIRIVPTSGGGSRLEADWSNGEAEGLRNRIMIGILHRLPLHLVVARSWRTTLDRYAKSEPD